MCAAITSAVIAVGTAGYQIYNAEKQKKDAKDAIRKFRSQDLVNEYDSLTVDTSKSQQQTEANLSNMATATEALRESGSRGVFAGIPRLNEANVLLQEAISSDLERQSRENKILFAQGEENIRAIRENREALALQGLGQQLQTSRQDTASGISNAVSGLLALDSAINYNKNSGNTSNLFSNQFGSQNIDTTITIPQTDTTKLF